MARIRLVHWNAEEAQSYLKGLRGAGHAIEFQERFEPALMKHWRESPPDAFVIDLSRLPSHGREIAIALRQSPRTRLVPIVFCDGEDAKVERVRRDLPDAAYCTLGNLRLTLRRALAKGHRDMVKPVHMMERYAARTAAQKLGIKEQSSVLVLDPPRDLARVLDPLPNRVEVFDTDTNRKSSVTLCFIHESHSLLPMLSKVRRLAASSKLWILWRKGGCQALGDVTESAVRESAIQLGLVDYKICSVNEVWSALCFAAKR